MKIREVPNNLGISAKTYMRANQFKTEVRILDFYPTKGTH